MNDTTLCTQCVLPATFPQIQFDVESVMVGGFRCVACAPRAGFFLGYFAAGCGLRDRRKTASREHLDFKSPVVITD